MVPYVIWDVLVTGAHWWFNEAYTLDFRLLGLPIEEWLFFITVPFACLFVWETLPQANRPAQVKPLRYLRIVLYFALPVGVWVFSMGREYTGLVLFSFGLGGLADWWLRIDLLLRPKLMLFNAMLYEKLKAARHEK